MSVFQIPQNSLLRTLLNKVKCRENPVSCRFKFWLVLSDQKSQSPSKKITKIEH